ncbi:PHP domain-containing protein [Nakamurella sp. YIM 132087]|uniref:PHP domain-containing protein n=1 Tax=Nakamurella alba TaxID=2665158 RepID=A0A7K1FLC7_9ACTN|nr:PHP domain-containing protein [Nakamurella alba]MTD13684.1 PHP domain-containing protein [Nakamurella alba]
MRIDLHAHSTASDGTDTPAGLIAAAAAAGLDAVAITDHDNTGGWAEAAAARPSSLVVVPGAEFSTQLPWQGRTVSVHLLGYLFDPTDPAVLEEQARLRDERLRRGIGIVEKMMAAGIPITVEQVLEIAGDAPVGRPHIGRALVAAGVVTSVDEAFASLLSGPGGFYVPKADTPLPAAIGMIRSAGGVPVLAHPRGRGESRVLTPEMIGVLAGAGLGGLEVDHPDHAPAQRAELRELAERFGLLTTGSSDYHGTNKVLRLGQETTTEETLRAIVGMSSGRVVPWGWSA